MTFEEHDRRYGPEPVEARQEREAVEDRAADHAPADERDRADSCASGSHHACTCRGERLREALAVARDLRGLAGEPRRIRVVSPRDLLGDPLRWRKPRRVFVTPKAGGRELDGRTWDEFPETDRVAA